MRQARLSPLRKGLSCPSPNAKLSGAAADFVAEAEVARSDILDSVAIDRDA